MKTSYENLLNQYKNEVQSLNIPNAGLPKLLFHERTKAHSETIQDLQSERTSNCRSAHEAAISLSIAMQSPLHQTKNDFKTAIEIAARRERE
mgnify:CR=1 FL=1|jgi:hypothetical protein|tara:strand:- start:4253 stop:4528 length:276 start_codon:yes stop_codon:yes gene_type:complete